MTAAEYLERIEALRSKRALEVTSDRGWLVVVGLHWLDDAITTIGSSAECTVVLPNGPPRLGTVDVIDNRVSFTAEPGVAALIGGAPIASAIILGPDTPEGAVEVSCGNLSFIAMDRGGRLALRVRNTSNSNRSDFDHVEYFAIEPSWNLLAEWHDLAEPALVAVDNVIGQTTVLQVSKIARFERDGRQISLLPTYGTEARPMFVFRDTTSGSASYASGRFVFGEVCEEGVRLDFNTAICPPCAFTKFATCALPPAENCLDIPIQAGERRPVWKV